VSMSKTPYVALGAAVGVLLIFTASGFGQERLAPTRNYNTYGNTPGYGAYNNTPGNPPEKGYGLPSLGSQGSEMPQQKTLSNRLPPTAGASAGANGAPNLGLTQHRGRADRDLASPPTGQSETGAASEIGAETATQPDMNFFSGLKPPRLNHASRPSDGMDTPMFTTPGHEGSDKGNMAGTAD
jgi:hypothetical protein